MIKPNFNVIVIPAAFCLLSGCGLQAIIGGAGSAGGIAGQVENLVPDLLLMKYVTLHNLKVEMQAVDDSPGPVTMGTSAPKIVPAR